MGDFKDYLNEGKNSKNVKKAIEVIKGKNGLNALLDMWDDLELHNVNGYPLASSFDEEIFDASKAEKKVITTKIIEWLTSKI